MLWLAMQERAGDTLGRLTKDVHWPVCFFFGFYHFIICWERSAEHFFLDDADVVRDFLSD